MDSILKLLTATIVYIAAAGSEVTGALGRLRWEERGTELSPYSPDELTVLRAFGTIPV
jgi:hypothetical protein